MERYKQYVDIHWWSGIEKRDIESWIRNFGDDDNLPRVILNHIIFYNNDQLKAYTRVLINRLKNRVYMECVRHNGYLYVNDEELFQKWNEFLEHTRIMPAASRGDPTNSAFMVSRNWRAEVKNEDYLSDINEIDALYNSGVRRFILVDDFSGSGKQITEFLHTIVEINGKKIEIGQLSNEIEDTELCIALYVIHKKSVNKLETEYPGIKWMAVDVLDDGASFINKDSYIYEGINEEQTQEYIDTIKRINKRIMEENREFGELSSYILNIPIIFEHGCPNNTLLLLFAHTDNWKQLFKRGIEI